MIPKECKRLAEVDFPIAVVSKHSAREKSIRHGHPSTLHLWWARRPLAACRGMLLALLLPDPCDKHCPNEFKTIAHNILPRVQGSVGGKDEDLRRELLRFIADFANWGNSTNQHYLDAARGLVRAAYGDEAPLVADPFSGGGSIPLEALRLGCDAFASDLNPVACFILKTMLEDVPRHGAALGAAIREVGSKINAAAEAELSELYPGTAKGERPIAYLWSRTITCDNCGAELPLMRSFWLTKKASRKRAFCASLVKHKESPPTIEFSIVEPRRDSDVRTGTVTRAKATCISCNTTLAPERVRMQLRAQRGGADVEFDSKGCRIGGARMLAVVSLGRDGGRTYRLPKESDYAGVFKAQEILKTISSDGTVPSEPLPPHNTNCFRIPNYGIAHWRDIATARQNVALGVLARCSRKITQAGSSVGVLPLAALAISRCSDFNSSLNSWSVGGEFVRSTFARQALSMVWDFCETMPTSPESGGYLGAVEWIARVVDELEKARLQPGQVQMADARECPLPDKSAQIWFTDPPYYDAVGYAELSDFFFVRLKRALPNHPILRDPFDDANPLVHKLRECVQDENYNSTDGTPKDKAYFEKSMAAVFSDGRRVVADDGVGAVVFAHKTTEGWESLLSGMVSGGWVITGSWPISTERPGRLRSQDSAALATSVHLICRPRPANAVIGDWANILQELPQRVGDWIERLQSEGIRGADLVFACIGPAMEIYSRYRRVEDAEGREIPLGGDPLASEPYKRGFLSYVWETVGRLALEQVLGTAEARSRNGAAGALEEDARLTALFLWTLQTTEAEPNETVAPDSEDESDGDDEEDRSKKSKTGFSLIFDVARRFAQPLGIHLDKWEGRIIETEKGIVRLLPVAERSKQLFGDADASAISRRIQDDVKSSRNYTFAFMQDVAAPPEIKPRGRGKTLKSGVPAEEAAMQSVTTLDRVHAAMLLQASGQANGLRALLKEEQQRAPDFLRLANALSALYPKDSEEKRLLDAMLLAVPRN